MSESVLWTRAKLERFIKAYEKALDAGAKRDDVFVFDGNEFVLGYAKYLIEYLEDKLI